MKATLEKIVDPARPRLPADRYEGCPLGKLDGMYFAEPTVGDRFLFHVNEKPGFTNVLTTQVQSVKVTEDGLEFVTRNSTYRLTDIRT